MLVKHVKFEMRLAHIQQETAKKYGYGYAYRQTIEREMSRLAKQGIKPLELQEEVARAIEALGVPPDRWYLQGFNMTWYTSGVEALRGTRVHFLQKIPILGWLDEALMSFNRGGEILGHILDGATGQLKWFNRNWSAAVDDLARTGVINPKDAPIWKSARSIEDVQKLAGKEVLSKNALDYSNLPADVVNILKSKVDRLPETAGRKDIYNTIMETKAELRTLYQDKMDMVYISRGVREEMETRIVEDNVEFLNEIRAATSEPEIIGTIDAAIAQEAQLGREFNVRLLTKRREQMLKRKTVERMAHSGIEVPEFAIYEKATYEHDKQVARWLLKRKQESNRWYEELRACRTAGEMDKVNVRHYRVSANLAKQFDDAVDKIWDDALKEIKKKLPDISPEEVLAELQGKWPLKARPPEVTPSAGIVKPFELPKPVEGLPEAGLQARFTETGEITYERFTPTGRAEIRQETLDDWARLQALRGLEERAPADAQRFVREEMAKIQRWGELKTKPPEIRAIDTESRVAEILHSKIAPDEKVRELRAILAEIEGDIERGLAGVEYRQQLIELDPVFRSIEYKKVPHRVKARPGEPIEMVRYNKGKWVKLEEAPLDDWGTELGIRDAFQETTGHVRGYEEILRDRIRQIPAMKQELVNLKAHVKGLDRWSSDYANIKQAADDLDRAVLTKRFNNLQVELDMATRQGASDDVIDAILRQMGELDDALKTLPPRQGEIMFDELTARVVDIAEKPTKLPEKVITETIEKEGLGPANPLKPIDDIAIMREEMEHMISTLDGAWDGFIGASKRLVRFEGANPEHIIPKFNDALMNSSRKALSQAKMDLFDYSMRTQFDYLMQHMFPFPFWNLRFMLLQATRAVENPGQLAAFCNLLKRWWSDTRDLPWGLQFSIRILTLDDGSQVRFRPFTFFFPLGYSVADVIRVGANERRVRDLTDALELISNTAGGYFYPPIELAASLTGWGTRERYGLFRPTGEAIRGMIPQYGLMTETLGGTGVARTLWTSGALTQWQKNRVYYALSYAINQNEITPEEGEEAARSLWDNSPNEIAIRYIQHAMGQETGRTWATYMGLPISLYTPEKQEYIEQGAYREEKLPYGVPHYAEEWETYEKKYPGNVVMQYVPPADLKPELKEQWNQTVNYWDEWNKITKWRLTEQEKLDQQFLTWSAMSEEEREARGLPVDVGSWWREGRGDLWEQANGRCTQLDQNPTYEKANKTREQTAAFQEMLGRDVIPIHPFTAALDGYYAIDIDNPEYQRLGGSASSQAWDKFFKDREDYLNSLTSEEKEYVLRRIEKNRTPLEKEYYKAQDVLKPYWELEETLNLSGLPKDSTEQTKLVIRAMNKTSTRAASVYERMLELKETDPDRYEKLRSTREAQTLFGWAERIAEDYPTVNQIIGIKREQMRRENPEMDKYLVLFYDYTPIEEQ